MTIESYLNHFRGIIDLSPDYDQPIQQVNRDSMGTWHISSSANKLNHSTKLTKTHMISKEEIFYQGLEFFLTLRCKHLYLLQISLLETMSFQEHGSSTKSTPYQAYEPEVLQFTKVIVTAPKS